MLTEIVLGEEAAVSGMLMSLTGAGSMGAALLLTMAGDLRKLAVWPFLGTALLGLAQLGFSTAPNLVIAALAAIPIGFAILAQNLSSNTLLQHIAPPELRGRVMAFYSMMMMGTVPLGALLTGWLVEWLGLMTTTSIFSMVCTASALTTAILAGKRPKQKC